MYELSLCKMCILKPSHDIIELFNTDIDLNSSRPRDPKMNIYWLEPLIETSQLLHHELFMKHGQLHALKSMTIDLI